MPSQQTGDPGSRGHVVSWRKHRHICCDAVSWRESTRPLSRHLDHNAFCLLGREIVDRLLTHGRERSEITDEALKDETSVGVGWKFSEGVLRAITLSGTRSGFLIWGSGWTRPSATMGKLKSLTGLET